MSKIYKKCKEKISQKIFKKIIFFALQIFFGLL